jgi:exosome complex RNA-binding protein Rrp42 (RNase PH superfamily)
MGGIVGFYVYGRDGAILSLSVITAGLVLLHLSLPKAARVSR